MLIVGTIIYVASLGAWLYAAAVDIDAGAILAFASPVVGFLLIGGYAARAASAAEQAASQTNGVLDARIKSATTSSLAERDQAKTWAIVNPGQNVTETLPSNGDDTGSPQVS